MRLSGTKLSTHAPNVGTYVWGYCLTTSNFIHTVTKTLEPTKMLIRSNSENSSNKRIYYGNNHAVCVSRSGRILKSKVYALAGEDLCCYTEKEECVDAFKKSAIHIVKEIELLKQAKVNWYNRYIVDLKKYEKYDK